MSTSITMKPNPFQRSNPFQVTPSYQPSINTSLTNYQAKPSYRPSYEPQSFLQKQNSFSKKPQNEMWKFREDNCGKPKVFNHMSGTILHQKYLQEKNSFEKELVLSSVGRRNHNTTSGHQQVNHNSGQQHNIERGPIENPFGRKYLISGNTLAESQVYAGFKGGVIGQQNLPATTTYDRYKTQYDTYTPLQPQPTNLYSYSNYLSPVPVQDNYILQQQQLNSNTHLQTSLYHKNSQYASRKSIERSDSHNRNSYNNLNPVESRYSLQRDNYNKDKYNSIGSSKDMYQPYPTTEYPVNSKASIPLAERDREVYSRVSVKEENVRFEQSDDEEGEERYGQKERQREPTFGSKNDIPALPGPQEITIKGLKFYRQNLLCY